MKRILSLLLALTLVFSFVACSNEKDTTSKPDAITPTQTETESTDIHNTQKSETTTINENSSVAETPSSSKPTETSKPVEPSNFTSSKTDDKVLKCPNFIGKTFEEVRTQYGNIFKFKFQWDRNNQCSYGVVYEQSVKTGTKIEEGKEIIIHISMGSETVMVPNVYKMTQADAIMELESKGFSVCIEKIDSSVAKGCVVKTKPERTEVVAKNTKITLYISTGIPNPNESKPNETNSNKESWHFYCEHCGEFLGFLGSLKDDLSQSKTCTICNKKMSNAYLYKNGILDDSDVFEFE